MAITPKLLKAQAEYQRKLKAGLVKVPPYKDPIERLKEKPMSRKLAIEAKCYDCCCFLKYEVALCTAKNCPLYLLRPWQKMRVPKTYDEEKANETN